MTKAEVLKRARSQKTVTVLVKCFYVDNDGSPLDANGDSPDGRKGWKQGWEWAKRSRPLRWLQKYPNGWRLVPGRRRAA